MDKQTVEQQEDMLARAEEMVRELQAGNERKVNELLQQIAAIREVGLYQEVGKVTRQLHDALQSFREDSRLDALAAEEIPDAQQRLRYVITMTEQAADRTLSAVEDSIPKCESLAARAAGLHGAWQRFKKRQMTADEFRELSREIEGFLADIEKESTAVKAQLNEVLMAQDFQDLTGQIIKRVIDLVEEVEAKLVELIRITGSRMQAGAKGHDGKGAEGPPVPGVDDEGKVSSQDEVDDLLSSLGF